jgi:hypothetical protein
MTDNEQARAKIVADYYAEFPKGSAGSVELRTETGTQRTRLNAYKPGLTGQIHLFTPEEHTDFEKHCQSIVEALAPVFALGQMADESGEIDQRVIDQPELSQNPVASQDLAQ